MRIYSAILELSRTLSMAQENTMNNFSIDAYVQAIINIINTPTYSDISNETACKYYFEYPFSGWSHSSVVDWLFFRRELD